MRVCNAERISRLVGLSTTEDTNILEDGWRTERLGWGTHERIFSSRDEGGKGWNEELAKILKDPAFVGYLAQTCIRDKLHV